MEERQERVSRIKVFLDDIIIVGGVYTKIDYSHRKIRESDILNRENEPFLTITNAKLYEYGNQRCLAEEKVIFINKSRINYIKPYYGKGEDEQ